MSMLRYLAPGGTKGKIAAPARGAASRPLTVPDGKPKLKIMTPNYGIVYLPAPKTLDWMNDEPHDDPMMHGELEITLPVGAGPKRCKAVRVGLKTVITLDMGSGRRYEEDVLFERKVEIISSTADGLWLEEGSQRFAFTIIVPSNLASHDWHTNGVISHVLYAEVEGLPEPSEWSSRRSMSSSPLFGFRRSSKSGSRAGSRGTSPTRSPPASPGLTTTMTRTSSANSVSSTTPAAVASSPAAQASPCGNNISSALSNMSIRAASRIPPLPAPIDIRRGSGSRGTSPLASPVASVGGGSPVNPAYLSTAQSLSITRQEEPGLPHAPSYNDAMKGTDERAGEWLTGTHTAKRNCMVVYNPNPTGGVSELSERASGYVSGLGVWEMQLLSDVWTIGSLLSLKLQISSLSPLTTVFNIKLLMTQTHSIISPRENGPDAKRVSTRSFTIFERGKRPPAGYHFPDLQHAAIWRGVEAGGKDKQGVIEVDSKCRIPNDNVGRPSTLPGVITPITVSHTLTLEITFSVYGEDDLGKKMEPPTHGGLRLLRVSRPVFVASCCLVPAVLDLPAYESHLKDPLAPPTDLMPPGLPGWEFCACGWKVEELEARMRQSVIAHQAEIDTAAERAARNGAPPETDARSSEENKMYAERERQRSV